MLLKLLGIVLIVVGGSMILGTLFPLIGSLFALAFLLVKLDHLRRHHLPRLPIPYTRLRRLLKGPVT